MQPRRLGRTRSAARRPVGAQRRLPVPVLAAAGQHSGRGSLRPPLLPWDRVLWLCCHQPARPHVASLHGRIPACQVRALAWTSQRAAHSVKARGRLPGCNYSPGLWGGPAFCALADAPQIQADPSPRGARTPQPNGAPKLPKDRRAQQPRRLERADLRSARRSMEAADLGERGRSCQSRRRSPSSARQARSQSPHCGREPDRRQCLASPRHGPAAGKRRPRGDSVR